MLRKTYLIPALCLLIAACGPVTPAALTPTRCPTATPTLKPASASQASTAVAQEATVGAPERVEMTPISQPATFSPEELATREARLGNTYLPGPPLPGAEVTPVPPSGGRTMPSTEGNALPAKTETPDPCNN